MECLGNKETKKTTVWQRPKTSWGQHGTHELRRCLVSCCFSWDLDSQKHTKHAWMRAGLEFWSNESNKLVIYFNDFKDHMWKQKWQASIFELPLEIQTKWTLKYPISRHHAVLWLARRSFFDGCFSAYTDSHQSTVEGCPDRRLKWRRETLWSSGRDPTSAGNPVSFMMRSASNGKQNRK